ncbi:MAG: hypothetical protein WB662_08150 [Methyloceanibacter sp.]
MIKAVQHADAVSLHLVAHLTIHWSGTDMGDDPNGKLFAKVREGLARWLRLRGLPFAGVWCREKKAGGQAEVEHCHLIFHLPASWLVGAKMVGTGPNAMLKGGVELLQVEAVLHRLVGQYAGRPLEWAVKLKVSTDGENAPGPYNGRSYDGMYLIKGGGPKVWKLFPRIRKKWRKPQGVIFGKRCGVTQNLGPAAWSNLSMQAKYASAAPSLLACANEVRTSDCRSRLMVSIAANVDHVTRYAGLAIEHGERPLGAPGPENCTPLTRAL